MVISGLALGTDGNAHAEALKNNIPTMGVLAHGLHLIYPSQHKKMAQKSLKKTELLLQSSILHINQIENIFYKETELSQASLPLPLW